jgi:hypothetical protein
MRVRLSTPFLVVAGVWLCTTVASAEAQQLDLSAYVGLGDTLAETSRAERSVDNYTYADFVGNAAFERRGPRRTVTARLGGALRYFPDIQEFLTLDRSASLGVDAQIGSNSLLRATQTVQFSHYRQFGGPIFPMEGTAALPVYNPYGAATVGPSFWDLASTVELSRKLNQRTGMEFDYGFRVSVTDAARELPISQRAGIGLRHMLSRYAALKLGTTYRFGRTGYELTALPTTAVDFEAGVDYNRALSFSRGTTVSFSSGTALVSRSATALEPSELGRELVVIAALTASQTLGRDWEAQLGGDRNLQYVEGFRDPFYATRIKSRLTGEIGQRFSVQAAADYSTGSGIGSSVSQTFNGFQAHTSVAYALTRRWELFGAFHLTENRLSPESLRSLPPGTIVRPNLTTVRIGVNFSVD